MIDDILKRLDDAIYGAEPVNRKKRWTGDTHAEFGGSIDEGALDRLLEDAKSEIADLRMRLRNVAAASNQLLGYETLPRHRQVELAEAIRRFTGIEPSLLREAEEVTP